MASSVSRRASSSACGNRNGNAQDYNTGLHVAALFIVLFVSTSACAFPIIITKFPRLRIPSSFLFIARHFGTGVLVATAFVHLLPTAFISLTHPCLPKFWTQDYPAMAGAIALAAVFLVTIVEMVFSPGQHVCARPMRASTQLNPVKRAAVSEPTRPEQTLNAASTSPTSLGAPSPENGSEIARSPGDVFRNLGPLYGRSNSVGRNLQRMGEEVDRLDLIESRETRRPGTEPSKNVSNEADDDARSIDINDDSDVHSLSPEQKQKKALLQCMLLEMGILFHSIFIGMALSVSVGGEFVVLLIAITFHQTFEGLALGSRITDLSWHPNALQPWVMTLAYGCTTPLGQAIGLATHTLYDPDSEVGLLVVGIMNAISSGLLIFASLVELMSEDFLSDESWKVLQGRRRVWACVLVFAGAFGMSLVGAWA